MKAFGCKMQSYERMKSSKMFVRLFGGQGERVLIKN